MTDPFAGLIDLSFVESFNDVARRVHKNSREKGFWDNERNDGEALMLMVSELSEALEALRQPDSDVATSAKIEGFMPVEEELADVIIRVMDYCVGRELRVAEALIAKKNYNATREHKHGKQF